jgi:hypothetical protein
MKIFTLIESTDYFEMDILITVGAVAVEIDYLTLYHHFVQYLKMNCVYLVVVVVLA